MGIVSIVSVVALVAASVLMLPALLEIVDDRAVNARATMICVDALIPAFNEAASIDAVVHGISPFVRSVTVVDDGSTDGTAELARASGAMVIAKPHNERQGGGNPRRAARRSRGSLLTRAADGRRPAALASGGGDSDRGRRADRRGPGDRRAPIRSTCHAGRRATTPTRSAAPALSGFIGTTVRDTQCGFRTVRGATRFVDCPSWGTDTRLKQRCSSRCGALGGRVATAPVTAVYDRGKSKLRPVRDTTRTCFLAVYYRFLEPR